MNDQLTIRVLYFSGCPNHEPAVALVEGVVQELGANANIEAIDLSDPSQAEAYRFLGSPTLQVNGVDVEPAARKRTDFALSCRTYPNGTGLPDRELVVDAVREANGESLSDGGQKHRQTGTASMAGGVGSAFAAVAASACCWIPLLFVSSGAAALGAGAWFQRWRPLFLAGSVAMLGVGFALSYF